MDQFLVNVTDRAIKEHPGFYVVETKNGRLIALVKTLGGDLGIKYLNIITDALNGRFTGATPGGQVFNTERLKQVNHYGFTIRYHEENPEYYNEGQLAYAAQQLSQADPDFVSSVPPKNWDPEWWKRMCAKGYEERLTIAGALLIAEYERLFSPRQ